MEIRSKICGARVSPFFAVLPSLIILACAPHPVRIGVLLPLSGPGSDIGQAQRAAVELASEKLNAAGGIGGRRLDLVIADTQGDPSSSMPLIKALLQESKVTALLTGSPSREALIYSGELERAGLVLLCSLANAPELTNAGEWVFRNCPSNTMEAKVLAEFAAYTLHASHALVFGADSAECSSLSSEFLRVFRSEGRTVDAVGLPASWMEAESAIAKSLRRRPAPQAVVLALEGEQLASAVRTLRKARLSVPILATNRAYSSAFLKSAGPAAESLLFAVPGWTPFSPEPRVSEFIANFQARTEQEPTLAAAQAYDAVFLLARAMSDRGLTPEEVRRGLQGLRGIQGVAGTTTFDANGDVLRSHEMWVIHEGRPVPLQRVKGAVLASLQQQVGQARFGSR